MATRTIWQDIYGIELDLGTTLTTHLGANPSMATATDIGFQGIGSGTTGKFGMPLTDHPNFKSPSGTIDNEQARGISERQVNEYNTVQTGEAVEFTLPLLADAYNIAAMATLFFQDQAIERTSDTSTTSGGAELRCHPYLAADTDNFGYFCRIMQGSTEADDVDLLVKGGICSTFALSSEAGGLLTLEATIGGCTWAQQDLGVTGTPFLTSNLNNSFVTQTPLKHQDMNCLLYDSFTDYSAVTVTGSDIAFVAATGTITQVAAAFVSSGFAPGDTVTITGCDEAGNNETFTLLKVEAASMVIDSKNSLTDELAAAGTPVITKIAEWVDVQVPSWSISMNNNATFNYYNDDQISGIHLGRLSAEGSFTMPWGQDTVGKNFVVDRFLAGNACRIAFSWGQQGAIIAGATTEATATCTNNELFDLGCNMVTNGIDLDRYKTDTAATTPKCFISVVLNARVTDYEISGDNELQVECTFQAVKDLDPQDVPNGESEYNSVDLYCCYDSAKLVSGAA